MPLLKTRNYYLSLLITLVFACSMQRVAAQESNVTLSQLTDSGKIFNAVETPPIPMGGYDGFYRFLAKTIRYPSPDKIYNIQGRVIVQFVVEKDGSLSDIKIVRSPSNTLSDETIRVLKLAPKWSPGIQNHKPVRVQYSIPVNYSLGGGDDQILAELMSFFKNEANYPDAIKNNHDQGVIVAEINVVKNHIADARISKGLTEELNKAVTNLLMSYNNEVKVRNSAYSVIFKFGFDAIDTSTLNGYAKPDEVIGTVEIKPTKK